MKNILLAAIAVAGLVIASASRVYAEDKTVTGQASCGKSHETLIKAQDGEETVTYHLVNNQVSKDFHEKVCKKPAQVKATGDVKTVEGRLELTPTSIELVKEKA